MKQAYRRWVCGLLACILALLAVCGAVVYVVDPCLYYRVPDKWQPVLFNERYQMAGLAKNVEADTAPAGFRRPSAPPRCGSPSRTGITASSTR